VEVDNMAFYPSIKIDIIPKVSVLPSWDKALNDIIIYDKIRTSRVAATMLDNPVTVHKLIKPYTSIRVIGGP